jgi:hypothetical protein
MHLSCQPEVLGSRCKRVQEFKTRLPHGRVRDARHAACTNILPRRGVGPAAAKLPEAVVGPFAPPDSSVPGRRGVLEKAVDT